MCRVWWWALVFCWRWRHLSLAYVTPGNCSAGKTNFAGMRPRNGRFEAVPEKDCKVRCGGLMLHIVGENMSETITREVLESHLKCRYKGYLKLVGERGSFSDYELLL